MEKKYIIISAALILIIILIICGIIFAMMGTSTAYETFTCNDTGTTFEVPSGLKVRQDQENYGIRYSVMSTPDGDIVIQRSLGDNPYMAEGMSGASDLINSYDGDKVNGVELHTCSRTAKNEATGEVIMVTSNRGDNETVDHIINSIKWGNKTGNVSSSAVASTGGDSSDKTYSYHGEGSYHVGDVVNDHDTLYQLQSNGQWVKIGEATGSEQHGYSQGYSDGVDDSSYYYDDYDDYDDYYPESSSSQSSSNVETIDSGGNLV